MTYLVTWGEMLAGISIIFGGLLVGIGTKIGKGCTSGHGICGVSLLSLRSIIATITFMTTAIIAVKLIG